MWAGRTAEQKEQLIKNMTKVLEDLGVPKEYTTVIIHDVQKENWGVRGEQASKVM